jgi:hypothetical protein
MKRGLWVLIAMSAIVVVWILATGKAESVASTLKSALGLRQSAPLAAKSKPICPEHIVPIGDCIPKYLANLPPDPGPEGERTLEGIDSDKDGVRDDVQRFIALHYGESERAVRALTNIAKSNQLKVAIGDSISREEAIKLAPIMLNAGRCYARTVDDKYPRALERTAAQVLNNTERLVRAKKFEYLLAHNVYPFTDTSVAELCGYDPASLPN